MVDWGNNKKKFAITTGAYMVEVRKRRKQTNDDNDDELLEIPNKFIHSYSMNDEAHDHRS